MPRRKVSKSVARVDIKAAEVAAAERATIVKVEDLNPKGESLTPSKTPGGIQDAGPTEPIVYPLGTDRIPMRKLWDLAHRFGAPVRDQFNREEVEASLAKVGYQANGPQEESIDSYWRFLSRTVGKGPITAVDPDGDFTAMVFPDGRCTLTKHTAPNLNNRVPGMRYKDDIVEIANLEDFASRLVLLLNESDAIFDETVEKFNRDQATEEARINALDGTEGASIHGKDWKIEQMREIAPTFGFVGAHEPTISDLPFKLAQALGVPLKDEDGEVKDWQELSGDVILKAVDQGLIRSTMGGPRYGRNKEEPVVA
jgi:hypothetical protein